jgi:hypothetical protein
VWGWGVGVGGGLLVSTKSGVSEKTEDLSIRVIAARTVKNNLKEIPISKKVTLLSSKPP